MVNIESVRNLIAFCLRTHSRLIHISTSSVAGMSINDVPGPEVKLTEQDFYIGQYVNDRKYTYSKFKAEELVLDAIAHHGLNAKIMRVGNLSARQKDGEFQINFNTNNFLALLRAFVVIGMVPYGALDQRFEFSPIDEVVHAVMLLSQTPKDCVVFHPYNTHRQFLSDILTGFAAAGITLKRVEPEDFQQALEKMMDNPDLVTLLRPLMAYNLGGNRKVRNIETSNDYTTQVLYRLGFQWPKPMCTASWTPSSGLIISLSTKMGSSCTFSNTPTSVGRNCVGTMPLNSQFFFRVKWQSNELIPIFAVR